MNLHPCILIDALKHEYAAGEALGFELAVEAALGVFGAAVDEEVEAVLGRGRLTWGGRLGFGSGDGVCHGFLELGIWGVGWGDYQKMSIHRLAQIFTD